MKRKLKFVIAGFALSCMMQISCKTDELSNYDEFGNEENFGYEADDTIIMQSDVKSISKGYLFKKSKIVYDTVYHQIDHGIKYIVMKVPRRKNPQKYFYVMVENLDFKTGIGCWAYDDSEKNVKKYGRLYTWETANSLASEFYMMLPIYVNGEYFDDVMSFGRLPNKEDILDIIQCDNLGHLPENGHKLKARKPLYKNLYYDAFIAGAEPVDKITDIAILAGTKPADNYNGNYRFINEKGFIWLSDYNPASPEFHHYLWFEPIKTDSRITDYTMFCNVMSLNSNGSSVRFVFEPEYIEE